VAALDQDAPGQMTWLVNPPPWLRHAYCFASVIVWTENTNVTMISGSFICFILRVKPSAALAACVLRATKKVVDFFEEKSARQRKFWPRPDTGWPCLRIFWSRNDLVALLRWRRHCLWSTWHWVWDGIHSGRPGHMNHWTTTYQLAFH